MGSDLTISRNLQKHLLVLLSFAQIEMKIRRGVQNRTQGTNMCIIDQVACFLSNIILAMAIFGQILPSCNALAPPNRIAYSG